MSAVALSSLGVLGAEGPEAGTFLQAQLSADILALAVGEACPAAWCSATGRVLASFIVLRIEQGYLLVLDAQIAADVQKRMSRYVLRAKLTLRDVSAQWSLSGWDEAGAGPADCDLWHSSRAGQTRWLRLADRHWLGFTSDDRASDTLSATSSQSEVRWRLAEIAQGRAWIGTATQDLYTPQMINLDLTGAISFTKGCYPGQEIVARTHYLGKVKRRMLRVRANSGSAPVPGSVLEGLAAEPEGTGASESPRVELAGHIINAASIAQGGWEGLAVMRGGVPDAGTRLRLAPDGPTVEVAELPYVLE